MTARYKITPDPLRQLIEQGHTTAEIAAHFGVQSPAVTRACHAHGLPLPLNRAEPTRADDERDLAFLRAATRGEPIQRTAARLGVSNMTVQRRVKAIEAADLAESGEPVAAVARHYPRRKIGGYR